MERVTCLKAGAGIHGRESACWRLLTAQQGAPSNSKQFAFSELYPCPPWLVAHGSGFCVILEPMVTEVPAGPFPQEYSPRVDLQGIGSCHFLLEILCSKAVADSPGALDPCPLNLISIFVHAGSQVPFLSAASTSSHVRARLLLGCGLCMGRARRAWELSPPRVSPWPATDGRDSTNTPLPLSLRRASSVSSALQPWLDLTLCVASLLSWSHFPFPSAGVAWKRFLILFTRTLLLGSAVGEPNCDQQTNGPLILTPRTYEHGKGDCADVIKIDYSR